MELFKSGNPTLNEKTFQSGTLLTESEVMTERGTLNKFFMLCVLVIAAASFTWSAAFQGKDITSWMWIGALGGLGVAIVTAFKPVWSPFLAPIYALLEGVFVGGISAMYNNLFDKIAPGIIMQAVALTFGTVIAMYFLYRFGVIKATERFRSVIITATSGIAIFYLLAMGLRFFDINIAFLHEGSLMGILFSLVVVTIAALNLILDFDMIEKGVQSGAPKFMEWYGAFSLVVTIVWLYLEILRLLSKLSSRN
ncbi:MAG: Bax inhibitor-1/YccA family protein [Chitinophagaceae bacterium]